MTPFSRILVPVDFSGGSARAIGCAAALAGQTGASLHLLHVVDVPVPPAVAVRPSRFRGPAWMQARIAHARRRMEGCAELVQGRVAATADVLVGHPAMTIADVAASYGCDLIVMGARGQTGGRPLGLGEVTDRVIRTAGCAVLTV